MPTTSPSSNVSPHGTRRNGARSDTSRQVALPDFLRCVWASDAAQSNWEPRIESIVNAWQEIEWLSVAEGVRPCALGTIPAARWDEVHGRSKELGLKIEPLAVERKRYDKNGWPLASATQSELSMRAVIGSRKEAKRLVRAWSSNDVVEIGLLLGYPECCCKAYAETVGQQDSGEPLWALASRSGDRGSDLHCLEFNGRWETNVFWRYVGVQPVAHIPCSFECTASQQLAAQFAEAGKRVGFAEEMDWSTQILRWPLEWSMLHGIAEMKTPILKLCTNAAASASKCTVRWRGDLYPADGVQGVAFPFRQPAFSTASRFVEGLNVIYAAQH